MTADLASSPAGPGDPIDNIHPELVELAAQVRQAPPRDRTLSIDEQRALLEPEGDPSVFTVEQHEIESVVDVEIPVDGDTIPARLYHPHRAADATGGRPVQVHFHGGGFWLGSIESSESHCRQLAARTGISVVSVGYRLAPEHRWPVPAEDCYAATVWVSEHAGELGVDDAALSVGGDSAGGNLAAVVALMARDRGGPPIVAQLLAIGAFDLTGADTPSLLDYGVGFGLDRVELDYIADLYVDPDDRRHPYASPVFAADLSGLPPAVVVTGQCDPLCDSGRDYAAKLAAAGVPVWDVYCAGHGHGTMFMTGVFESAREHTATVVDALLAARAAGAATGR